MYKAKDWVECASAASCKVYIGGVSVLVVAGGSSYIFVDVSSHLFTHIYSDNYSATVVGKLVPA